MKLIISLASVLFFAQSAYGFGFGLLGGGGGGCGCAPPPPPPCLPPPSCPAPACAPAPAPVCPAPPPPQQTYCPPAPACPVCAPPPPAPCPQAPPPPSPCAPQPQPCPQVQVTCPQPQPPARNDCCRGCGQSCRFKTRKAFGVAIKQVTDGEYEEEDVEKEGDDAMCNSEYLKAIMINNMSHNSSESKRAIQKSAEYKFEKKFDVICATGEFSYVVHSSLFCQTTFGDVTCYAFEH